MLTVKILCDCGAKYSFDVEPVNGQMPGPIQCPTCGIDGTAAANESIRTQLGEIVVQPTPPTPPAAAPSRLSLSGVQKPVEPEPPAAVQTEEPVVHAAPKRPTKSGSKKKKKKSELAYGEANMKFAVIGAVASGLICMLLWWASIEYTGFTWGILAWIVGGIVGFGGRLAGGGSSQSLGFICALSALIAIIGGELIWVNSEINSYVDELVEESYAYDSVYWKDRIDLETEEQIRTSLADEYTADGAPTTPEEIDEFDIKWFKDQQTEYRPLIKGEVTKEEFYSDAEELDGMSIFSVVFLFAMIGFKGLFFIGLGVITAYKLGSGIIE